MRKTWRCTAMVWMSAVLLGLNSLASAQAPAGQGGGVNADKARLLELIARAHKFDEKEFDISTWTAMRLLLVDVQAVANRPQAGKGDCDAAFEKLNASIDALKKRETQPLDLPMLGLCASTFVTRSTGPVNNIALMWAAADRFGQYELQRAVSSDGPFESVYKGSGKSYLDHSLADGTYFYRVIATRNGQEIVSNLASASTSALPAGLASYSNQQASTPPLPFEPQKAGDTYYSFRTERDGKALKHTLMRTSKDGKTWSEPTVVMDRNSHPDLDDFKFEAGGPFYDKLHDQFLWWCHWERAVGYGSGRAFVASAKPGQPFKVHHIYNPLGIQVRDMSIFTDDDRTGYLVAASNVPGQGANATMYIFKLNETFDDVVEITAKVLENEYREAPHIIHKDGYYYLFFSQAAGWYPSRGGYISARSLAGPWSGPRNIGNSSTFSSQSGGVPHFGNISPRVPLMMGNRWVRGEGTSPNSVLPIQFAQGFAFYDYAPVLLHDVSRSVLIPMQMGQLLSQGKPVESSIPAKADHPAAHATDGNYDSFFEAEKGQWPFSLTTDLGRDCLVRNVQMSWHIHKGSEAFYTYRIEGSMNGKQWTTLLDRTDAKDPVISKTYGFTSDLLPEKAVARYVRLTVLKATLHNNPNNWYTPTIYEMKIFGDPVEQKTR